MDRVCMVPDLVAELVMGRVCYGPSLSWAEFVMGRDVPESLIFALFSRDLTMRARALPVGDNDLCIRFTFICWFPEYT